MDTNVSAFFTKLQNEPELQAQLVEITTLPIENRASRLLALSSAADTPVSIPDLQAFAAKGEIPDSLLEEVNGGIKQPKSPAEPREGFLDGLKNEAASLREFLTHFGINL